MIAYIWVFLACAVTTFAVTPIVRRLALRFGAIDQPSDRNRTSIPTQSPLPIGTVLLLIRTQ